MLDNGQQARVTPLHWQQQVHQLHVHRNMLYLTQLRVDSMHGDILWIYAMLYVKHFCGTTADWKNIVVLLHRTLNRGWVAGKSQRPIPYSHISVVKLLHMCFYRVSMHTKRRVDYMDAQIFSLPQTDFKFQSNEEPHAHSRFLKTTQQPLRYEEIFSDGTFKLFWGQGVQFVSFEARLRARRSRNSRKSTYKLYGTL